ncbi:MAG: hypothetical protein K9G57_01065 [Ignavibacteriales bacterium]|nr:hypothetical protein [Ignavibacteriales bacterium]
MSSQKSSGANTPKTAFGRFMVYTFIPRFANNVMGLVYVGAALLIIIVGLRGLGAAVQGIPVIDPYLLDNGKLAVQWVLGALILEFLLLLLMATVTFFTPEDDHGHGAPKDAEPEPVPMKKAIGVSPQEVKDTVNVLKTITDEELKMIEGYLDRYEKISLKITEIQKKNLDALNSLKDSLKH